MPLDTLPGTIVVLSRDQTRDQYLASFRIRNPNASTKENTFPWIDACALADTVQMLYRNSIVANNNVSVLTCRGAAVDQRLKELGRARLPAIGGSGYVIVEASGGGTTIQPDDEIKDDVSGIKFRCTITVPTTFQDGDLAPIIGKDIGEQTNLDPGTVLTWTSPRPGSGNHASVFEQNDGSGISGGHGIEGDGSAILRVIDLKSNPPASGNDAQYREVIEATPGVAVERAFVFPCILGSGSIGYVFTIRPSVLGATRIPNGAQRTAVYNWVTSQMEGTDQIYGGAIIGSDVDTVLKVTWRTSAQNWVDTAPWPEYFPIAGQAIIVTSTVDSTHFTLSAVNGVYTGIRQPKVGQSFALYDQIGQQFRKKKILSFTGTGPWVITCDVSSDVSYAPVPSTRACPWSDALNDIPPVVIAHYDSLGPGEQVASFFDFGARQRRDPPSPAFFPSTVSNRLTGLVQEIPSVQDADLQEPAIPLAVAVGVPGVTCNMHVMDDLAVFPQ